MGTTGSLQLGHLTADIVLLLDGVIDQDPLGVDQIYVQAKRYAEGNNIGAGSIRDFFGALNLRKAQKSHRYCPGGIRVKD